MSTFVGCYDEPCQIKFNSAIYSNCFIMVTWFIEEANLDDKKEDMTASQHGSKQHKVKDS